MKNFSVEKGENGMSDKQRGIFRMVIAVIFIIGGVAYMFQGEQLCAAVFILAGALFGFKAIKGISREE